MPSKLFEVKKIVYLGPRIGAIVRYYNPNVKGGKRDGGGILVSVEPTSTKHPNLGFKMYMSPFDKLREEVATYSDALRTAFMPTPYDKMLREDHPTVQKYKDFFCFSNNTTVLSLKKCGSPIISRQSDRPYCVFLNSRSEKYDCMEEE